MSLRVRTYTRARASDQAGFGMIELLIAMTVMSVGILAVFAIFQSALVHTRRASTISTTAALADTEMENYRAVKYETIGLAEADVEAADATYADDSAFRAISTPENELDSTVVMAACPATPCTESVPTKTASGADGRSYRIDTYVTWQTVAASDPDAGGPLAAPTGRNVKLLTIVVRDEATARTYARVVSSFDESTGL